MSEAAKIQPWQERLLREIDAALANGKVPFVLASPRRGYSATSEALWLIEGICAGKSVTLYTQRPHEVIDELDAILAKTSPGSELDTTKESFTETCAHPSCSVTISTEFTAREHISHLADVRAAGWQIRSITPATYEARCPLHRTSPEVDQPPR